MFFVRNLLKSVKLYQKGCDTTRINQASEKKGESCEVREGDRAHKEYRKTYTEKNIV